MKKVITLNLIAGFVLAVLSFCFLYIDFAILFVLSFFPLLILIFVNLILIFTMWREYKRTSFIPFAISLAVLPLMILSSSIGHKIGMYRNPPYYDKYFDEERRKDLTAIAEELLQTQDEYIRHVTEKKLRRHHLFLRNINRHSNIVEFGYSRPRILLTYIYAEDGLPEIYSTNPIITEEDIRSWAELVDIVKTENNPSKYNCDRTGFAPEIAYPYLIKYIDKIFVDKLAAMESHDDYIARNKINPFLDTTGKRYMEYFNVIAGKLNKEEKLKVIEILNKQYQISSGLVEDSNITWKLEKTAKDSPFYHQLLRFGRCVCVGTNILVGQHLKQLISDGVISVKDKEGHLQVKSNLSEQEIREIEWLQVEMMDWIYGGLVNKKEYWSNGKIKLEDNWYFYW